MGSFFVLTAFGKSANLVIKVYQYELAAGDGDHGHNDGSRELNCF
jgi:hypothetical protein